MKVGRENQSELKVRAADALEHYEGILSTLKTRLISLLQRYAFVMFGKGLGLKVPKASKCESLQSERTSSLLYSHHFQEIVACVVRQEGATRQRKIVKRVSRALQIPKTQILKWLAEADSCTLYGHCDGIPTSLLLDSHLHCSYCSKIQFLDSRLAC